MSGSMSQSNPFEKFTEAVHKNRNAVIQSESPSTGGKVFGLVFAICCAVLVVMVTVKLGLMMFT